MDIDSLKTRLKAAKKSLMALASEAKVNYHRLYLASRACGTITPEDQQSIEKVLQSWGV